MPRRRTPRVIWILPSGQEAAQRGTRDSSIAERLSQLAVLTARSDNAHYLTEVAHICGQVIAPAAAISVTVGPRSTRTCWPRTPGSRRACFDPEQAFQ